MKQAVRSWGTALTSFFVSKIYIIFTQIKRLTQRRILLQRNDVNSGPYACCLVGGTFDRFHSGHKLLLNMAITRSKKVEIHIISDDIASRKSAFIQDFHTRYNAILDWLEKKSYQTVKLFPIK